MNIPIKTIKANGIAIAHADLGQGPLVLFCHGWPEGFASWRHQLLAVAAAGYRAVAPDMRGYGETDAPAEIERYSILDLVADQVELVKGLGAEKAVIVGHDWGAPVAWHCALLRPDMFSAVVGMSVPWTPAAHIGLIAALEKLGIRDFYMQHFQPPGLAEAELEVDVEASLRRVYFTGSGNNRDRAKGFTRIGPDGFLANTVDPPDLPDWLPADHLAFMAERFRLSGFRGGLNWYRNLERNARLMAPWRGLPIRQPSLFIAGEKDGVLRFPASKAQIEAYSTTLPACRGVHILEGAGHWIQQERPDQVNALLLGFLQDIGW